MSEHAAITVIICTWNRAKQLKQTLDSLRVQSNIDPAKAEVLVVDNNSSDDTRSTVNGLMPHWQLGNLRYAFEPRQGKQFALNTGIHAATHEVLAFTDDDILFPQNWLASVQDLFASPHVRLAGGRTDLLWPASGKPDWFADDMMAVVGGVDLGPEPLDPAPPHYVPAGANLLARRALFDQVGGFSESHFRHMDHEFGTRCQRAGVRVVYDPRPHVIAPVDLACLHKRYFRRWAFKAGIANDQRSDSSGAASTALPWWVYRQALQEGLQWPLRRMFDRPADQFSRELRLWRRLGAISSHWHARFNPQGHAEWIAGRSQKKNNRSF